MTLLKTQDVVFCRPECANGDEIICGDYYMTIDNDCVKVTDIDTDARGNYLLTWTDGNQSVRQGYQSNLKSAFF